VVGRDVGPRLLAGFASMTLLAACAAGASPTPPPASPTPTSKPSAVVATPTPAPTPGAVSYGPVTVVTGTGTCPTADLGSATTDADGVTHYRGGIFRCTMTTGDPRVSGTETAPWNMDLWGTADDGALVQWGTSRLENDEGAWEGTGSGVYSSDRGDIIAFWYKGTGGYAGLSYFELWTGQEPWTIQGQIIPGDPPNPTGALPVAGAAPAPTAPADGTTAPTPTAIAYGPVSVVTGMESCSAAGGTAKLGPNGTSFYRDEVIRCTDTANDPRVSGRWTGTWNEDNLNGAIVQWGVGRLTNAGGAWEGRSAGIRWGDGEIQFATWWTGTGGYAGLAYFQVSTGTELEPFHGQIFPGTPPTP
jgi:hypothetical protein